MTNLLQKLMFWRKDAEPEPAPPVSEQRPNVEQDAAELRRETLRKDDRKLEERDEFPTRPNYEP